MHASSGISLSRYLIQSSLRAIFRGHFIGRRRCVLYRRFLLLCAYSAPMRNRLPPHGMCSYVRPCDRAWLSSQALDRIDSNARNYPNILTSSHSNKVDLISLSRPTLVPLRCHNGVICSRWEVSTTILTNLVTNLAQKWGESEEWRLTTQFRNVRLDPDHKGILRGV